MNSTVEKKNKTILGEFSRFDLNPIQNMKTYGTTSPPTYNLKNVSAPVAIYYAINDILVAAKVLTRTFADTFIKVTGKLHISGY